MSVTDFRGAFPQGEGQPDDFDAIFGGSPGRSDGRTPPQDNSAEQSVLGAMLLSKDAIADVVESIRGTDFYRPAHELLYDAIIDLYGRGEPADAVTLAAELARRGDLGKVGGAPYLHTLVAGVPIAANAGYYAEIVRERAILRRLVEAGTKIAQLGYTGEGQVDDVVDRAQAEVYSVTDKRSSEDYTPLGELMAATLDEIEAISAHDGGLAGVPTGFADLDDLTNGLHPGQMVIVAARPAMGKALALDTPLPTPTGWTNMGDVAVGDELIGADGQPTRVVAATPVMNDRPCYQVTFSDGSQIVADAAHQWLTETRAARKSRWAAANPYNPARSQRIFASVRTTAEIEASLRVDNDRRANHAVVNAAPLQTPEVMLPVAPYKLGVWLGDGHSNSAQFTSADPEIAMYVEGDGYLVTPRERLLYHVGLPKRESIARRCEVCGLEFVPRTSQVRTCGRSCGGRVRTITLPLGVPSCPDCGSPSSGCRRCQSCHSAHGSVQAVLRTLGVLGSKHIPAVYLRASERQRRDLLAGLLDTDGTVTRNGNVQFAVVNEALADGVYELVVSLGYRCGRTTRQVPGRRETTSTCHILNFTTEDDVFRLTRKAARHKERRTRCSPRGKRRYITGVERIVSQPVRCVEVDNADHLYLAGGSMIPTHNSMLALDFCRAASIKHGMTSVFFSLEMNRTELTMRLLSAEAKIALNHMRNGHMNDDDWARLASKMGEVSEAPLFIDDSPNMTMMEIRAKARRLKQRHGLRLVVVDYLQLMTSGRKVESRQVEVSEFSRQMKLLAKELAVPIVAISQLNRGAEQRTDKRPFLSDLRESGCLTADTGLMRADNGSEITLGALMTSGGRDIPVWSLDDRLKLVPRTLTHAFPSGTKEVFCVRLASGREVTATAGHPFLTYDGWKPLADLAVGSRVGVLRHVPDPLHIQPWDDDEVVLLGHLLGHGSFVRRQSIRYASTDEPNLATVAEAASRRFGITAVRDEDASAGVSTLRLPTPNRLARGERNPIAAWLDDLGLFGLRSHQTFVPPAVFGLPKHQLALFLRHLWATDGSVRWDAQVGRARICYASPSRRLVDGVAALLLRHNIVGRLKRVTKAGCRDIWQLHIDGAEQQRRICTEIGVHGSRGEKVGEVARMLAGSGLPTDLNTVPTQVWDRVRDALRTRQPSHRQLPAGMATQFSGSAPREPVTPHQRLAKVATILDNADLEILATNDVCWDSIVSVESLGEADVYDATVLGTHNFVANGIALHNSLEQDADLVVLLHREDAYERESARPGEADLIVAKHRSGPTDTIVVAFQGHYSRFVDMQQT